MCLVLKLAGSPEAKYQKVQSIMVGSPLKLVTPVQTTKQDFCTVLLFFPTSGRSALLYISVTPLGFVRQPLI